MSSRRLLSYDEIKELMKPKLEKLPWQPVEDPKPARTRTDDMEHHYRKIGMLAAEATSKGLPLKVAQEKSGLNPKRFYNDFDYLVRRGWFLKTEQISLGRPGTPPYYSEITELGAEWLELRYDDYRLIRGKNKTLPSRLMVTLVAQHLEREGCHWEAERGGADLWSVTGDGTVVCWEIETAPEVQIARNVSRDITELQAAVVNIVMERKEDLQQAEEICRTRLSAEEMNHVNSIKIEEVLP